MKKIFTLISMAFVAMSMNAQESWSAADMEFESKELSGETKQVLKGMTVTSLANDNILVIPQETHQFPLGTTVDDVKAWIAANPDKVGHAMTSYVFTAQTTNVTMTAVSSPDLGSDSTEDQAWQIGTNNDNQRLNTADCPVMWSNFLKVKSGAPSKVYIDYYDTNSDGDPVHRVAIETWTPSDATVPAKGVYYEFDCKKAGELTVGVFMNKNMANRPIFVLDESTPTASADYTLLPNTALTAAGFFNNNGWNGWHGMVYHPSMSVNENYIICEANPETSDIELAPNQNFLGYISFNVEAGKKYMLFTNNGQVGIYGFYFEASGSDGISNVKVAEDANAPVYNLAGQKADKNQKGILIQNGKKFVNK